MKDIRIGFLGTGGIADQHARSLGKLQGIQIVGLCNRHVEKAMQFAQKHAPTATCIDDFARMLADVPMDALYVCLPPGEHKGQTEAAAARGIHLFLEKPIALDLARAESIAAAVRKAGVKCQIGHHLRHTEAAIRLHRMIQDGSAGKALFMQGSWFCNALHPQWWQDPAIGGGQLIEQAIHIYDMARYFLGRPEIACGFAARLSHQRFPDYQVDDVSAASIRFTSGAIASISATNVAEPCQWSPVATIQCEKVMVQLHSADKAIFIHHEGKVSEEIWRDKLEIRREELSSTQNCYDEISRNFIAAVREGEPLRSGIEDGIDGLRLVLAVAKSSREDGMPQRL